MSIVFAGSTSGTITLQEPAVAGTNTISLPANTGTVITTASSAVVTPALLAQPLTLGTAVASTSGTSIDFTSIPSWVKRITIMLNRVSTNGSVPLLYQIGTSEGLVTSGYVSSGAYCGDSQAGTQSTAGFLNGAGGSSADTSVGITTICNFGNNNWVSSSVSGDGTANYAKMGGGSVTLGGNLDRVRITTTTGTPVFDGGSINILYE